MYTPGKLIAVGLFGLFVWLTGGPILFWLAFGLGMLVLLYVFINKLGSWIDVTIEGMTEWKDE